MQNPLVYKELLREGLISFRGNPAWLIPTESRAIPPGAISSLLRQNIATFFDKPLDRGFEALL